MRTPNRLRFAFLVCVALILALPIPVARAADIPMIDAHSQVSSGVSMDLVLSMMRKKKVKVKGVKSFVASCWHLLEPSLTCLAPDEIQFVGQATMS